VQISPAQTIALRPELDRVHLFSATTGQCLD